jgi:hypothetical protein
VLGGDAELLAALVPAVAAIAGAVVGQDPLDDHAAFSEPGPGSAKEPSRGLAALIRVDLGVGQPGVVIDGGVDIPLTNQGVVMAAALSAGAVGLAVASPGGAAQEPVATPAGMLPSFLTSMWTRAPGWSCS